MRIFLQNLALFAVYVATAWFGLRLDAVSGFATLVWAPTGIAMAALFLYGRRLWPGIALGAFCINLYTGAPPLAAFGIALGNTLEAYVGAALLRRAGFRASMDRLYDAACLTVLGGFLATAVSATFGVASLWLGRKVGAASLLPTWQAWWIGDMLGALVVAPLLLTWLSKRPAARLTARRAVELALMAGALLAASQVVFGGIFGDGAGAPIAYLVFVPLIWAGLRFGIRGTSAATFALAVLAVWGTIRGSGPFAVGDLSDSLLYLQVFMGSVSVTALFMASSVAERKQAEEGVMLLNSELKRGKKELQEERRRDAAMLEAIGDGVVAVDQGGRVIAMNRAAELMLGFRLGDLAGQPFVKHVPLIDAEGNVVPAEKRPASIALRTAETVKTSISPLLQIVRKDGTRFPVAMTAAPIVLDFVRGAVLVFREITRETELDHAKTEFISFASHQLRNPVSVIRWNVETLLANAGAYDAETKETLERVHGGSLLMAELVDALLNVSRLDAGTYKPVIGPVDLVETVKDVLAEFELVVAKKSVAFRIRRGKTIPAVMGDRQFLRIAIQNLVSNAVKYTREGTTVTIGLDHVKAGERAEGKTPKRDVVMVTVTDEGVGIPARQADKIFTKFFRADNVVMTDMEGTGLGLYLTKSIVSRAGGDVWFESEEGKGSAFHLMIPLKQNGKA